MKTIRYNLKVETKYGTFERTTKRLDITHLGIHQHVRNEDSHMVTWSGSEKAARRTAGNNWKNVAVVPVEYPHNHEPDDPKVGRADYVERQEGKRERYEARADKARSNASALDKQASAAVDGIPMGQPILVGHHSERRHRAALKRAQTKTLQAVDEHKKSEHYTGKAAGVGTGGISSDDPEAVVKLREKITDAEKQRDIMKAVNQAFKKHKGDWEAIQKETGISDRFTATGKRTMELCPYEKKPFPSYALTNLGVNIRRMKKRIESLLANARISEAEPEEGDGYRIEEDKAENRIRFYFDEKPSREVCRRMKQSGFRWSPRAGAWQRMLNPRARTMAELMAKELFPQEGGGS